MYKSLNVKPNQSDNLTSLKVCNKLLPDTERVMSMWCIMKRGSSWLWYGKHARLSAMNSNMLTSVFCRKNKWRGNYVERLLFFSTIRWANVSVQPAVRFNIGEEVNLGIYSQHCHRTASAARWGKLSGAACSPWSYWRGESRAPSGFRLAGNLEWWSDERNWWTAANCTTSSSPQRPSSV